MGVPLEEGKLRRIPQFLKQETMGERGISTCYPTSIINAAIALNTVSLSEAEGIHREILDALRAHSRLWNGPFIKISVHDDTIATIVESRLPIRLGDDDLQFGHRLFLVPQSFPSIYKRLVEGEAAQVVIVEQGVHAYSVVGTDGTNVVYVDPFDQYTTWSVPRARFDQIFHADKNGWVTTTPVRPRVRVL